MTPQYLFEMGDERGNVQSTGTPLLSNLCSLCSRDFPNYKKKLKKLQVITLHHFLFNLHIKVINFKLFQLHSVHHAGEQKIKTISRSSFLHIAELYSSFFLFFFSSFPPQVCSKISQMTLAMLQISISTLLSFCISLLFSSHHLTSPDFKWNESQTLCIKGKRKKRKLPRTYGFVLGRFRKFSGV